MTTVINEQVEEAIIEALRSGGGELTAWAEVRRGLPGTRDQQNERLIALWYSGRVWIIKIRGRNYVGLGDDFDSRIASSNRISAPRVI